MGFVYYIAALECFDKIW